MIAVDLNRSPQTARRGASAHFRAVVAILVLGQMALSPVQAQLLPDTNRSTPSGSPLDGNGRSSSTNDGEDEKQAPANAGQAVPDYRIQPVQVGNADRIDLGQERNAAGEARVKKPAPPNEFERFVLQATGEALPRFGADLLLPSNRDYAVPATATVPPDYVLNVGDVVAISMAGSIEGSVEKQIDTDGRIFLPRVGPVRLAGVRYGDLKTVISATIGTQYRGYTVNVAIRHLRGIRVYVTGFANHPGAYSVNSLSTMINAVLAAGGPSSGGSFRSIRLVRNNEVIRTLDLYDFILRGRKADDAILQNQDVIEILPVGGEVAISGSVNAPAIFEVKPGETLEDLLRFAGGPNSLADGTRVMLYRMADFDSSGVREIDRAAAARLPASAGDIVQILSEGSLIRPMARQSVLVRIEGEVERPGNYYLPANAPLSSAIERAGGLTAQAFVFGTRFERVSVRRQQRVSFDEAVRQLEVSLAAAPLTSSFNSNAGERNAQIAAAQAVLEKLRQTEPDGRMVLDLAPGTTTLPGHFVLENNDRIVVPPRPTTVGVFGAVYRPASFLVEPGRAKTVREYLELAGGALRSGDRGDIFVVRANGAVLSKRDGALSAKALPGDVIFVPVKAQSNSIWTKIRELTTILFQLGLSTAAFIAVTN